MLDSTLTMMCVRALQRTNGEILFLHVFFLLWKVEDMDKNELKMFVLAFCFLCVWDSWTFHVSTKRRAEVATLNFTYHTCESQCAHTPWLLQTHTLASVYHIGKSHSEYPRGLWDTHSFSTARSMKWLNIHMFSSSGHEKIAPTFLVSFHPWKRLN